MKKLIAILYLFIVVLSCLLLSGCNLNSNLDREVANQLREDYVVTYGDELSSELLDMWYCGTYRGNIAFYPWSALHYCALMDVNIAGVKYIYPDSRQILIYSDGEFYTMAAAYEMGLIGYFDIYAIFARHDLNKRECVYLDKIIH